MTGIRTAALRCGRVQVVVRPEVVAGHVGEVAQRFGVDSRPATGTGPARGSRALICSSNSECSTTPATPASSIRRMLPRSSHSGDGRGDQRVLQLQPR